MHGVAFELFPFLFLFLFLFRSCLCLSPFWFLFLFLVFFFSVFFFSFVFLSCLCVFLLVLSSLSILQSPSCQFVLSSGSRPRPRVCEARRCRRRCLCSPSPPSVPRLRNRCLAFLDLELSSLRPVSVFAASPVAAGGARLRRPRPRLDSVLPVMLAADPCRQRGIFSSRRCTGVADLRAHHPVDCARLGLVTRSFSRSDRSSWALSSRLRNCSQLCFSPTPIASRPPGHP